MIAYTVLADADRPPYAISHYWLFSPRWLLRAFASISAATPLLLLPPLIQAYAATLYCYTLIIIFHFQMPSFLISCFSATWLIIATIAIAYFHYYWCRHFLFQILLIISLIDISSFDIIITAITLSLRFSLLSAISMRYAIFILSAIFTFSPPRQIFFISWIFSSLFLTARADWCHIEARDSCAIEIYYTYFISLVI